MGTALTNKYAEGLPGKRYYGGCEFIDVVETLAIERAERLFGAAHANVQPHSGSNANLAAYFAVLKPGDKILGMELSHGGHLTHGSDVNFSGQFFEFVRYGVSETDQVIDFDQVRELARQHRPKMIQCGYTAYPRTIDFRAFGEIAREVDAVLFADIAHIAGLVAATIRATAEASADADRPPQGKVGESDITVVPLGPGQFARPNSDIVRNNWGSNFSCPGGPLWAQLDETTPDDFDTVIGDICFPELLTSTFEVGLSSVEPPAVTTGHTIRVRTNSGLVLFPLTLRPTLKQGGTTIASFVDVVVLNPDDLVAEGFWFTRTYTLTSAQAASITDYGSLSISLSVTKLDAFDRMFFTQLELEVPLSAPVAPVITR